MAYGEFMRFLTPGGYQTFRYYRNASQVEAIDIDRHAQPCHVEYKGKHRLVRLQLSNGEQLLCQPNDIVLACPGEDDRSRADVQVKAYQAKGRTLKTFSGATIQVIHVEEAKAQHTYTYSHSGAKRVWGIVEDIIVKL